MSESYETELQVKPLDVRPGEGNLERYLRACDGLAVFDARWHVFNVFGRRWNHTTRLGALLQVAWRRLNGETLRIYPAARRAR